MVGTPKYLYRGSHTQRLRSVQNLQVMAGYVEGIGKLDNWDSYYSTSQNCDVVIQGNITITMNLVSFKKLESTSGKNTGNHV